MDFVTLQEASDHLRRDTTRDDADLQIKITAASDMVRRYVKYMPPWEPARDSNGQELFDSAGNPIYEEDSAGQRFVRSELRMATLQLIDELYNSRGGEQRGLIDAKFGYGYLPRGVIATLYGLRTPTLG